MPNLHYLGLHRQQKVEPVTQSSSPGTRAKLYCAAAFIIIKINRNKMIIIFISLFLDKLTLLTFENNNAFKYILFTDVHFHHHLSFNQYQRFKGSDNLAN
jgi:hypothetical protein